MGPLPTGPVRPGRLPVKIATSGTPRAAARCNNPVSTPTTNCAPAINAATWSSGLALLDARTGNRSGDALAACALQIGAPWQSQLDISVELFPEGDPMLLRPKFLRPSGGVKQ